MPLREEGCNHTFDFTHVNDVVRGLRALIGLLESDEQSLPPVHLVSGHPTSLGELAANCCRLAKSDAAVAEAAPRSYDVARFYGDPARARELLGWKSEIVLEAGLTRLIEDFKKELALHSVAETSV